jgi:hypothetical protein
MELEFSNGQGRPPNVSSMPLFNPGHGFARGFMQLPARFFLRDECCVHGAHFFPPL